MHAAAACLFTPGTPTHALVCMGACTQAAVPVLLFTPAELDSVRDMLAEAAEPVLAAATHRQLAAAEQACR